MDPIDSTLAALDWVPSPMVRPLNRLEITTWRELLEHYPRRHEDRAEFSRFPTSSSEKPICVRGVVNKVSNVKLLQGDLAEAWREGDTDYATVAMRFSLNDFMVDRASGRVVEGDPTHPQEVAELWTFRRAHGGPWMLSAIQQTG